jgi:DNA-binding NarL/FixJ family response regulator
LTIDGYGSSVIRVVLVDDHALIREGLRRAVDRAEDMSVVGEANSIIEARAVINHVDPTVCVLDVRLPDGNGLDLCREVRGDDPAIGVIMLTMYGDDVHLLRARSAGASAFVSKDAPAPTVVKAIRHAATAPNTFIAEGLADAERNQARQTVLTNREQEVLNLLAEGLGIAGISSALFISESTAKTHVAKIYGKLGASNRAQALMTAVHRGLVPESRRN